MWSSQNAQVAAPWLLLPPTVPGTRRWQHLTLWLAFRARNDLRVLEGGTETLKGGGAGQTLNSSSSWSSKLSPSFTESPLHQLQPHRGANQGFVLWV